MKKNIYYKKNEKLIRALLTNEESVCSNGLPVVKIKNELYGVSELVVKGISELYAHDEETFEFGKKSFYNIKLLENAIRQARIKKNLTQKELADKVGVTSEHVQMWERGTRLPGRQNTKKLIQVLDISAEELL